MSRSYKRATLTPPFKSGVKPSMARLLDMVNDVPPGAWAKTVRILQDMADAGIELDEQAIEIARKLGCLTEPRRALRKTSAEVSPLSLVDRESIVYYIRRGELIKIGTTVNPIRRFASLLPDEILAFEPGDKRIEIARHRQFAHLRTGRNAEYFRPAPDLLRHAQRMRDAHGEPPPEWPTTQTIGRSALPDLPAPTSDEAITIPEASATFDVPVATIRAWARRRRIYPAGLTPCGVRTFYFEHIKILAEAHHARI